MSHAYMHLQREKRAGIGPSQTLPPGPTAFADGFFGTWTRTNVSDTRMRMRLSVVMTLHGNRVAMKRTNQIIAFALLQWRKCSCSRIVCARLWGHWQGRVFINNPRCKSPLRFSPISGRSRTEIVRFWHSFDALLDKINYRHISLICCPQEYLLKIYLPHVGGSTNR